MVDVADSKSAAGDSVPVRVRSPAPRRSKLCIACSDFFQKSERTHSAAPPFQPRSACAGLASDDENGLDLNCITSPIKKGGFCLPVLIWKLRRTRTHLNATVLRTVACSRLDGNNTTIFFAEENINRVRSPAPNKYNPNQIFRIGKGFGLFVYFTRYEQTYFANGWEIRPESKPRGPRKKKPQ